MMDLESKGELPAPRSYFSIFDPKIHLAIYGSSLYEVTQINKLQINKDRISSFA